MVDSWLSFCASPDGPRVHRLQEVNVTILPPDVCNQYYLGRMRPSMFCAGKEGGGADACQVQRERLYETRGSSGSKTQQALFSCCSIEG